MAKKFAPRRPQPSRPAPALTNGHRPSTVNGHVSAPPKPASDQSKLKVYQFHGVDLSRVPGDDDQSKGDCPFCGASGHFFVEPSTGKFQCKTPGCGTGNSYTFLNKVYESALAHTDEESYANLAKLRSVSVASLKAFGFAVSSLTGTWVIPGYNEKGKLANLYKVVEVTDSVGAQKYPAYGSPGCKLQPFGRLLAEGKEVVHCTEGVWDGCAMYDLIHSHSLKGTKLLRTTGKSNLSDKEGVMAVPGAGSFDVQWIPTTCQVLNLGYDNDHPKRNAEGELILASGGRTIRPGWDGMQRACQLLAAAPKKPAKITQLQWEGEEGHTTTFEDGYDLRDLIKDKGPTAAFSYFRKHYQKVSLNKIVQETTEEISLIEPIECTSFGSLINHFESVLHITQEFEDTFAVMLAVILSTPLDSDPIWTRIIGPPGSGKTTLAECVTAAREYVMARSLVTGFHSGFIGMGKDKGKDSSLIPEMDNKTLVMKDADTLTSSSSLDRILSELRDLYDGVSRAQYRNRKTAVYEGLHTTFILCGTDDLRALNRTFLGERFLDCEILGTNDRDPFLNRAMDNVMEKLGRHFTVDKNEDDVPVERELILKQATYGFIKYLREGLTGFRMPLMSQEAKEQVKALGKFLAYMRAKARRQTGKDADLMYRPRVELATRLVSQLTKMAICLALVLGRPTVDTEIVRLLRKVVTNTAVGFQFDITKSLLENREGINVKQIEMFANVPQTTIRRIIDDMQEFEMIKKRAKSNHSGQRGRDTHIIALTDELTSIYDIAFKS